MRKLRWLLAALLLTCGMGPAGTLALLSGGGMSAAYDFTASVPGGFTFARTGTKMCWNGSALASVATGVPCIEPSGGPMGGYGLLLEPGTTNGVRNSVAAGSTNGVMGSGGVAPTYWTVVGIAGAVASIVGTGYESGIPYCDVSFSGTPTSSGAANIYTESTAAIAASAAQTWTSSHFLRVVSGSMTNISLTQNIINTGGTETTGAVITPTTSALISQRFSTTETAPTGTTSVYTRFRFGMTSGQAVSVTIRVGGAQMEQLAWASSLVVTSGSAGVRQADALSLPLSAVPWLVPVRGYSAALSFDLIAPSATQNPSGYGQQVMDFSDGVNNDDYLQLNVGALQVLNQYNGAFANSISIGVPALSANVAALSSLNGTVIGALNGATRSVTAGFGRALTNLYILYWHTGNYQLAGHVRRLLLRNTPLNVVALAGLTP